MASDQVCANEKPGPVTGLVAAHEPAPDDSSLFEKLAEDGAARGLTRVNLATRQVPVVRATAPRNGQNVYPASRMIPAAEHQCHDCVRTDRRDHDRFPFARRRSLRSRRVSRAASILAALAAPTEATYRAYRLPPSRLTRRDVSAAAS